MKIIKTIARENGSRPPIQSWSEELPPDGFTVCPEEFIPVFTEAKGFVNIEVKNGDVVSMTENTAAKKAWEATQPAPTPPEPTPQEEIETLKARAQASEDALMFLMDNGGM